MAADLRYLPTQDPSRIQPDVTSLLRDVILSLCQRKYNNIADIEVDGIICISFLESVQLQQVVKIHETLKADRSGAVSVYRNGNSYTDPNPNPTPNPSVNLNSFPTLYSPEHNMPLQVPVASNRNDDTGLSGDTNFSISTNGKNTKFVFHEFSPKSTTQKGRGKRGSRDQGEEMIVSEGTVAPLKVTKTGNKRKRKKPVQSGMIQSTPAEADRSEPVPARLESVQIQPRSNVFLEGAFERTVDLGEMAQNFMSKPPTDQTKADTDEYSRMDEEMTPEPNFTIKKEVEDPEYEMQSNLPVDVSVKKEVEDSGFEAAVSSSVDTGSGVGTRFEESLGTIKEEVQNQSSKFLKKISGFYAAERGVVDTRPGSGEPPSSLTELLAQDVGKRYKKGTKNSLKHKSNDKSGQKSLEAQSYKDAIAATKGLGVDLPQVPQADVTEFCHAPGNTNGSLATGSAGSGFESDSSTGKDADKQFQNWYEFVKSRAMHYQNAYVKRQGADGKGMEDEYPDRIKESTKRKLEETISRLSASSRNSSQSPTQSQTPSAQENPKESQHETGGKLESRYPALFKQLQKAKELDAARESNPTGQSDSLLNRLPFIPFQEIFPSTRSPSSTASLSDDLTFGKGKYKDGVDEDWEPGVDSEPQPGRSVTTRLSTGEKRRKIYSEPSDDIIEEEFDYQDEEPTFKYHCQFGCGKEFKTERRLIMHEAICGANTNYTCHMCGLNFNQRYRWHYHMVKVHNVVEVNDEDFAEIQIE